MLRENSAAWGLFCEGYAHALQMAAKDATLLTLQFKIDKKSSKKLWTVNDLLKTC